MGCDKRVAYITLFSLDVAVWIIWVICGWLIFGFECGEVFLLVHVVVGVHFGVQTLIFTTLLDESYGKRNRPSHGAPLTWVMGSIFAFSGDLFLLVNDARIYATTSGESETCRKVRIFELALESAITVIAFLSIIWGAALAIKDRKSERVLRKPVTTENLLNKQH